MSKYKNQKDWKDIWEFTENPHPIQFDDKKAFLDFLTKVESEGVVSPSRSKSKIFQLKYIISAVAAVFIGVFAFTMLKDSSTIVLNASELATEYTLPDKSRVILYPHSTLSFSKNNFNENRNTVLSGKALFDVTKSNHSFTINQGEVTVTVLGTSFIVSPQEVKVLEGKVKVVTSIGQTTITTREKVNLERKDLTVEPATFSEEVLSSKSMSYDNESLGKVLSDMEVKFDIAITNPKKIDISTCLITATNLSNSSFDECLKVLNSVAGLQLKSLDKAHFDISALSCN